MSKKFFLLIFCFWGLCFSESLAVVKKLEIYRNGVFLVEEFQVRNGENKLFLQAPVREEEIEFLKATGFEILSLEMSEGDPPTDLHRRLKALKEQEKALSLELERLKEELEILEMALEADETPPATEFQKYLALFQELWQKREKAKAELSEVQKTLTELQKKVAFEKVTVVRLLSRGRGKLSLRYPAGKLISYRESYAIFLDSKKQTLKIKASMILRQRSGSNLGPLTVHFYPRSESFSFISPPPFKPWILEDHLLRPRLLMEKAQTFVRGLKPRLAERELSSGAIWERLTLKEVVLPSGRTTYLSLAEEALPVEAFLIEVPLYATTRAFFRADLKPDKSYPRIKAKIYLDGSFVGETWCGPFEPGKEARVYFGPARLLEVKREVLKDLTGDSFWGKKVRERETRTTIINHYKRRLLVEAIERVPVPRRKEIKVEVEADPPWTERTPEGKVVWRFELAPEEKKVIRLYLRIKEPKDE